MLGASALWNASRPAAWVQEATTGFQHLSPEFWPRGHSRPPSTRDAETGGQGVQSQPGLHSCLRRKRLVMPTVLALGQRQEARCEFEASLAHTSSSKEVRPTSKESVHTNPKGRRKRETGTPPLGSILTPSWFRGRRMTEESFIVWGQPHAHAAQASLGLI